METLSETEEAGMLPDVLAAADRSVSSVSEPPLIERESATADSESLEESLAETLFSNSCRLER